MRWKGSLTPMVALMLVICIGFSQVMIEGSHGFLGQARSNRSFLMGMESALGNYDKELAHKYHIFAIAEPNLKEKSIEGIIQSYMINNLRECNEGIYSSFYEFSDVSVEVGEKEYMTTKNLDTLKYQIREYMKYQLPAEYLSKEKQTFDFIEKKQEEGDTAKHLLIETKQQDEKEKEELAKKEKKKEEENNETKGDSQSGESNSEEKVEDPREVLKSILKGDLVYLFTGKTISKDQLIEEDEQEPEKEFLESFEKDGKIFDDSQKVVDVMDDNSTSNISTSFVTDGLNVKYLEECLSHLLDERKDHFFKYETEYIIAGKDSEYNNVKKVLNEITAIRFIQNFGCVMTHSEFDSQALLLATKLVGKTFNPAALIVVKYLLLAALAYGESLYETRVLCQGGRVPLWKNASNFNMSLKNLGNIFSKPIKETGEDGLSYQNFLQILLLKKIDKEETYARLLEAMERTKRMNSPDFCIKDAVMGFCASAKGTVEPIFFDVTGMDSLQIGEWNYQFQRYGMY